MPPGKKKRRKRRINPKFLHNSISSIVPGIRNYVASTMVFDAIQVLHYIKCHKISQDNFWHKHIILKALKNQIILPLKNVYHVKNDISLLYHIQI